MKKKGDILLRLLFILLMVFLFLPMIQKETKIFKLKPLKGVFEATEKPQLTFENYVDGKFQLRTEKYLGENFGFREPVIRLYNQYVWSLFNKTYCDFIVPGKEGYLYYAQAVNDYYGTEVPKHFEDNAAAMAMADKEVALMQELQDKLQQHGITFFAFMAPDKPFVYPEYMPHRNPRSPEALDMVDYYHQKMTEADIPHIEMTRWYQQMRDTASFDVFTKTDSHWRFASVYGYDSIFRYMNSLSDFGIPKIHIGPVYSYETDELEGDEETLNLMFPIKGTKTKYKADIDIECDSTCRKPRVLFVGDSFIWSLETFLPWRQLMEDVEVWFYNSTAYIGFEKEASPVSELNRLRHILNADYVVFYSAGHQWWQTSYGFLEDAVKQLNANDSVMAVAQQMNVIGNDPDWRMVMRIQASSQGKPMEKVLEQEALNVLNGWPMLKDETVVDSASIIRIEKAKIEQNWRSNNEIMRMIAEKAQKKDISVDSMLQLDIDWLIQQRIAKGILQVE